MLVISFLTCSLCSGVFLHSADKVFQDGPGIGSLAVRVLAKEKHGLAGDIVWTLIRPFTRLFNASRPAWPGSYSIRCFIYEAHPPPFSFLYADAGMVQDGVLEVALPYFDALFHQSTYQTPFMFSSAC
ncbi:hypothetical protein EI94DRAFT_1729585 [Lactarius quietus]|nr:hypothetical protein EI94DRAFT_1729585 [Lactarius quietus]